MNTQTFSKIEVVLATNCELGLQWEWAFQSDLGRFIKITGRDSPGERYPDNLIRITFTSVTKADQLKAINVAPIRIGYGLTFYSCLTK